MLGLGKAGYLHGVVNVRGSARAHHLEIEPQEHMASSGGLPPVPAVHSHVVDRPGLRTEGTCTTTPVSCQPASAIEAAGRDYEAMDVSYNPAGPNSNSLPEWVLDRAGVPGALGTAPSGAVAWDFYRTHPDARSAPPSTGRPHPTSGAICQKTFAPTVSLAGYVELIRAAELALNGCGVTSLEQKLIILSGIYYGPTWSKDYEKEQSPVRNEGFALYTDLVPGIADDPRACLRCNLFEALKASQDVTAPQHGRVDMGHIIIGLNARMRAGSRATMLSAGGATGVEAVTWVGDLGGAVGRLAIDRTTKSSTSSAKYFTGSDYGAPSNLEGDVAAAALAGTGAEASRSSRFQLGG